MRLLLPHLFIGQLHISSHYFAILIRIKTRSPQPITPPRFAPLYRTSSPLITVSTVLPWQMNKNLIFLIFPVFSGFSNLFTFLHFSLILVYLGISLHIFVINFGKNFGKFQVCTKSKSAIGNRQVRIAYFMPSYQNYLALLCFHLRCQSFLHYLMLFSPR